MPRFNARAPRGGLRRGGIPLRSGGVLRVQRLITPNSVVTVWMINTWASRCSAACATRSALSARRFRRCNLRIAPERRERFNLVIGSGLPSSVFAGRLLVCGGFQTNFLNPKGVVIKKRTFVRTL